MASDKVETKKNSDLNDNDASSRFDIQLLHDSLANCCEDNNALDLKHYLVAFRELYRFFSLLGSVFGFVASDIISKICILEEYMQSSMCVHYTTIQSMIEYELTNKITLNTSQPSGSRTLLRLHRSLEFIMSFMHNFSIAEPMAKSSAIAQKCYQDTLAKHHPWLIQKGAFIAMYSLPIRQQFIEKVYGSICDEPTVKFYSKMMGDIASVSKTIYEETQKLYKANDLLNLP